MYPLTQEDFNKLQAYLSEYGGRCDWNLKRTCRWLIRNNFDPHMSVRVLKKMGMKCDCEIVLNVWRDDW